MQRRAGDDDAADGHGVEVGDRGQGAGAADLDVDLLEEGLGLFGRKFPGDGPARRAADGAEAVLEGEVVDFEDDTVDVVGELRAFGPEFLVAGGGFRLGFDARREAD